MQIKGLIDEDFANYKKPSMFIAFPKCNWKCEKECGQQCCQNSGLAKEKNIEISKENLVERYINNEITQAIVFGGLEPFDTFTDLISLVIAFRKVTDDDIVIYTGYNEKEVYDLTNILLAKYKNIIIKFGRYVPNQESKYDEILGVDLASPNQYARRIS